MSRKFSIVRTLDTDKIIEEIDSYMMITGEFNPYIFMSEETSKAIEEEVAEKVTVEWLDPSLKSNYKGTEATFAGCKVFINNDLKFGVVEIR